LPSTNKPASAKGTRANGVVDHAQQLPGFLHGGNGLADGQQLRLLPFAFQDLLVGQDVGHGYRKLVGDGFVQEFVLAGILCSAPQSQHPTVLP
jgi:hypothetical protein